MVGEIKMCKELTVIWIFSLGLLADFLWFQITQTFDSILLLQISLALFLLTFIVLVGKRFLARRFSLRWRFLPVSAWKFDRSGFRSGFWKRQTLLPRV